MSDEPGLMDSRWAEATIKATVWPRDDPRLSALGASMIERFRAAARGIAEDPAYAELSPFLWWDST